MTVVGGRLQDGALGRVGGDQLGVRRGRCGPEHEERERDQRGADQRPPRGEGQAAAAPVAPRRSRRRAGPGQGEAAGGQAEQAGDEAGPAEGREESSVSSAVVVGGASVRPLVGVGLRGRSSAAASSWPLGLGRARSRTPVRGSRAPPRPGRRRGPRSSWSRPSGRSGSSGSAASRPRRRAAGRTARRRRARRRAGAWWPCRRSRRCARSPRCRGRRPPARRAARSSSRRRRRGCGSGSPTARTPGPGSRASWWASPRSRAATLNVTTV